MGTENLTRTKFELLDFMCVNKWWCATGRPTRTQLMKYVNTVYKCS